MKKIIILVLTIFSGLIQCTSSKTKPWATVQLTNTTAYILKDKAISIKRDKLPEDLKALKPVFLLSNGTDTIPAQLDDVDNDGKWDELFFVAELRPKEDVTMQLFQADSINVKYKTNVSFGKRESVELPVRQIRGDTLYGNKLPKVGATPYQTDGPAWENEKIGFRHYFDGRHSKDLFAKRQPAMVLDQIGLTDKRAVVDNYHVLEAWGRDVLSTSTSAGIGGIALLEGDSLVRLGILQGDTLDNVEKSVFKVVKEGPVRSLINFKFINWKTNNSVLQVNQTSSIWPGMYAYKNEVTVEGLKGNEFLLVGLVNNNTDKPLKELQVNEEWIALITHDKQTYEKEYWLGMAIVLPRKLYAGSGEAPKTGKFSNSFYGKMKIKNGIPMAYYTIAGWELSDPGFKDESYFTKYVNDLVQQIAAEVDVKVNH